MANNVVWELSTKLWDRLRSESVDGKWQGSLTSIFREWDERPNQTRVVKALQVMGRIKIERQGKSTTMPTILSLWDIASPLSIEEFNDRKSEIMQSTRQRVATYETIARQRSADIANRMMEHDIRLDNLEDQLRALQTLADEVREIETRLRYVEERDM